MVDLQPVFLTISKKQTITADSSTYAEFIAAHTACKQIIWARNFLSELGFPQQQPTKLFEDNQSTIRLLNQPGNNGRTKHIALRFNIIREMVDARQISVQYLPTTDMTSDILTKATAAPTFLHLRPSLLGMHTTTPYKLRKPRSLGGYVGGLPFMTPRIW